MNIRQSPGQFKPEEIPWPHCRLTGRECLGEIQPCGKYYAAIALIHGSFPIHLGVFLERSDAASAIIEAHGGDA
jgi:hypothetical protein